MPQIVEVDRNGFRRTEHKCPFREDKKHHRDNNGAEEVDMSQGIKGEPAHHLCCWVTEFIRDKPVSSLVKGYCHENR